MKRCWICCLTWIICTNKFLMLNGFKKFWMNNCDGGSCVNNCWSWLIIDEDVDVNRGGWWLNKFTGNTAIAWPSYWKFESILQSRIMWLFPHLKQPVGCLWKQSIVRWFFRPHILQLIFLCCDVGWEKFCCRVNVFCRVKFLLDEWGNSGGGRVCITLEFRCETDFCNCVSRVDGSFRFIFW